MNITPKDLFDAGVHFGHQTRRWNPRSKPYIYQHRQGVSIIDLGKTFEALEKACAYIEDMVANGGEILFVGSKRQAQEIVREAATTTNMPYCVNRWLGGTLTNFETIKKSMAKFKKFQQMETSGEMAKLPKKEESAIKREMVRMQRNFDGITNMGTLPAAMFVVDVNHHKIAVAEANRVGMATIGVADTNSDPTLLTYPIPANDDAVKSIRIIVDAIIEAVQKGLSQRDSRRIAKGSAELRAAQHAASDVAPVGEIDLEKIELPANVKDLDALQEEVVAETVVAKKKLVRAPVKRSSPKTE